jgi:hypothetical protein
LEAFVESDWASDPEFKRSTNGYLFKIGNSSMSWYGKRQTIMALSLVEAKYHALMEGTKEIVWPRKI